MTAPAAVLKLVEKFETNAHEYRAATYNETALRRDFLDPFFAALGWDVANERGESETRRDVLHEFSTKSESGKSRAPDYAFRAGQHSEKPLFFVEAKKPSVNLRDSKGFALQTREYGWNAGLPFCVLTDFEEFVIYDCRFKPVVTDGSETARSDYFKYTEYADKWEKLVALFGREAVYAGALQKKAQEAPKKGTVTVDAAFLHMIEGWRARLADNLARNNRGLSAVDLNYAVQMTIDRIVFLRIAEDRDLETWGRLQEMSRRKNVYAALREAFTDADVRYNSGLFHFAGGRKSGAKKRPGFADTLTPNLKIDDNILEGIISDLYRPNPFNFRVMPIEILGQVYEQFLGKVIQLKPPRGVKVEDKPEVRKAGGVYYTPSYIVDAIVKQTVGALCEGKTPKQVEALRVLDPACGSGSFLIGAYNSLLGWHLDFYTKGDPRPHCKGPNAALFAVPNPPGVQDANAAPSYRLTTREKKKILLNNIYGVDIDRQAVEVTKLSLLLKVLEDESSEGLRLLNEPALPDLDDNIQCGNSLIGNDFYDVKNGGLARDTLSEAEQERINAFDWDKCFQGVMKGGGFDAIIGNPPYRREKDFKHLMDEIARTEFGKKYRAPRMDLWYYFVHRGLELLKKGGSLSFITNAYWTAGTGAEKLILALQNEAHLDEVFFFGSLNVFYQVSGQHMIFRVSNAPRNAPTLVRLVQPTTEKSAEPFVIGQAPVKSFSKTAKQLFRSGKIDLQPTPGKLLSNLDKHTPLGELGLVRQGIAENPATINRKTNETHDNAWEIGQGVFALTPKEVKALKLPDAEKSLLRPYHDLCDIGRYVLASEPSRTLIYSTRDTLPDIKQFPVIGRHLKQFRVIMDARRETLNGANSWWHLHWPRDENLWRADKILSVQMGERPAFVPSYAPTYVSFSVNVFVPSETTKENLLYLTGLLNSRLLWKWYEHNAKRRGVGLEINGNVLSRTPICRINFADAADKARHDNMVSLVETMLELQQKAGQESNPATQAVLARRIASTDAQIDALVYELYGLSEDEIALVEGG